MAIIQENFSINGRNYIRTYSNSGVLIHGGFPEDDYEVSEDLAELNRVYVETNIPVESNPEDSNASEILSILMGDTE